MWEVELENIGGIRSGETRLHRGINVLRGTNFAGKSSFLSAIQAVMGTTGLEKNTHPLTEGADTGYVELKTESKDYNIEFTRTGGIIQADSDTFLSEEQDLVCANLFAFLGENNPVRSEVRAGADDLVSLLQQPLDIENIDKKLRTLQNKRATIETDLNNAKQAAEQLPSVQESITQLQNELEQLKTKRDRLEKESDNQNSDLDDIRSELNNYRVRRENIEGEINTLENKVERQKENLNEAKEKLSELEVPEGPDVQAGIEQKETRIKELRRQINLLEDLRSVNRRVIEENYANVITSIDSGLNEDQIVCWVSGDDTTREEIKSQLNELGERAESLRTQKNDLEEEVKEIRNRREKLRQKEQKRDSLKSKIQELKISIDENSSDLSKKREKLSEISTQISDLEESLDDMDNELSSIKADISIKERRLEEKQHKIDNLESEAAKRDTLQEQYDTLTVEIKQLRGKKERKQTELVEEFDQAMADLTDRFDLGFENARLEAKKRGTKRNFKL